MSKGEHLKSKFYRYTDNDCVSLMLGQLELRKHINDPQLDQYWSELEFYKGWILVLEEIATIEISSNKDMYLWLGCSEIQLVYKPANIGERRLSMVCPDCKRFVDKIFYKSYWSCFKCHDLIHLTSKRSAKYVMADHYFAAYAGVTPKLAHWYFQVGLLRKSNLTFEQIYTEETKMKSVTIKLSLKQVRELDRMVEDLGIRKSEIIRRAIDNFFDSENLKKIKLRKLKI